jgi:hypothetical protein
MKRMAALLAVAGLMVATTVPATADAKLKPKVKCGGGLTIPMTNLTIPLCTVK